MQVKVPIGIALQRGDGKIGRRKIDGSPRPWFSLGLSAVCVLTLISQYPLPGETTDEPNEESRAISFHADIQPILSRHCYGCHQGAKQMGSYVMTDFESLVLGETNVKFGLSDRADLQLVLTPWVYERERTAVGLTEVDGVGDVQVRLKWNLFGNRNGYPT